MGGSDTKTETIRVPRVGVALGGGSARGFAHIGALAALERHGVRPDVIVGTSFGAVVGAMYATGRSPEALAEDASRLRRRDVFPHVADFGVHRGALFSGERLETLFERILDGRTFADLERPFGVVATDVGTGERVVIQEGSLARALRASSSLPGVFAPVEIEGRPLMDGGIGSPIPVRTLERFDVDVAIGIGAGVEFDRSDSVSLARRALATAVGRGVHRYLGARNAESTWGRLGLGLARTADAWMATDRPAGGVEVHTRPPISWLCFHQAGTAIAAGAAALDGSIGTIHAARAEALAQASS